ncbi:unnamed protein product [Porites evermanni]|uniref:Uncharacterized protein n=1 Tax=Porites evermanni TaxID=104178 RepID=A0ABN8LGW9_9CNID|nr:unnamed protein product [Porites evermanni]
MDGISSTPIENSVQFLGLRDKYKSDLLDDSRLTKAAGLAAQKELLLEKDSDEDEGNLAVGPLQQFMGNISKISKAIKRKAEPMTPQSVLQTPVVKQTPSTSKKPKLSFKTGSKGKRFLPKTPKKKKSPSSVYKTPQKTAEKSSEELATELPFSDQVGESPWKSPGELARESLKAIRRRTRKSQSEERKKRRQ